MEKELARQLIRSAFRSSSERMLRPEPAEANANQEASRFWDSRFAGPERPFSVGNIVKFDAVRPPPNFPFPHATEDVLIPPGGRIEVLGVRTLQQVAQHVADGLSPTLLAAFGGGLTRASSAKAYVTIGYRGPSLGAIERKPKQVSFHENTFDANRPKLRARIEDDGVWYDLSITADALRTRWKASGLAAVQADAKKSDRLHLRVGLSRPLSAMRDKCYAQVNGVYFL
jgi:ribosomal protein L28